jgi:hypothetical protein
MNVYARRKLCKIIDTLLLKEAVPPKFDCPVTPRDPLTNTLLA